MKRKSMIGHGKERQMALARSENKEMANFKKPRFEDLKVLGLLGSGGFGAVRLVKDKGTKKTYAFKQISKGYVWKMNLCDQICNERKILAMTCSPFITQFYCTFNSQNNL